MGKKKKEVVVEKVSNTTKIVNCNCQTGLGSTFQDQVYGAGRRVANVPNKDGVVKGSPKCVCCGRRVD